MNSHDIIGRARRPTVSAARGGLWLLPWASVLVLSASLAQAAEQALVHTSPNPPVELVMTPESAGPMEHAGPLAKTGARWLLLSSDGEIGTPVVCLAASDRISTDVLYAHPDDLSQVASAVCQTSLDEPAP